MISRSREDTGEFENVHGSIHLSLFDPETFQNDIHLLP